MVKERGQVKTPRNTNNREVTNLQITAKNGTVADNSNKIENKVAEPHDNKITTKQRTRNKAHSVNNLGDGINRLKHQDNDKDLKTRKEVIYTCSICLETFKKNAELKKHKKTHNETFLCKPCRVAFSEHYEYIIHMLKHNNCKSYKCNECGKVCKIKRLFKDHVATHFEFLFDCNICKRTYKSENSYKKHLRHHRTSMKCGECGKEFQTSRFFDNHMMAHIGLKPYQCYYCGKGFVQETNRNIHMRVHTNEKPHECKLCLEKFRHYSTLYRHMENHDETIMKYGCHACGKKFYHSERLTRHMRTHKNLCTCTKCNKKFTDRNLEKHIKTVHVSRMIFKCDLCNVAFRTVRGLQLHSKTKLHLDAT